MQIGICIHICSGGAVRTPLDLDGTLLEEAREALGASTFTEAIEMALRRTLVRRRGAQAWKVLEGSDLSWGSPEELTDYRRTLGGRSF